MSIESQLEEQKQAQKAEIARGHRLSSLTKQSGWQDIREIFQDRYHQALRTLVDLNTSPEEQLLARAAVIELESIFQQITNGIRLGESAVKDYQKRYGEIP